jgi:hypothetical protein
MDFFLNKAFIAGLHDIHEKPKIYFSKQTYFPAP